MRTILLDIDTQNDFCTKEGALYVPGADGWEERHSQVALAWWAAKNGIPHVATADDHLLSDPEISDTPDFVTTFPPHCMRLTAGARKVPWTAQRSPLILGAAEIGDERLAGLVKANREVLLLKQHFNCFTNPNTARVLEALAPERVIVFGVATDICVAAAITGLLAMENPPQIVLAYAACAGIDKDRSADLMAEWEKAGVTLASIKEITGAYAQGMGPKGSPMAEMEHPTRRAAA